MEPTLFYLLVVAFTLLGALSALWFFQTRRLLIARMKRVVEILEATLRPRDKSYTLLGYLVGFRADYYSPAVRGVERAWVLYTQPPRHVLLYLPLLRLAGARERLEVTLRLRRPPVPGEAHLYAPWDRATRREVARDTAGRRLTAAEAVVAGRRMLLLYNSEEARERALRLAERLAYTAGVAPLRVTLHHDMRAVHVALEPRLSSLERVLGELVRAAGELAGGTEKR